MEKGSLIKAHKPPYRNLPNIWTLPDVRSIHQFFNLQHELDCADLFIRYFPHFTEWDYQWTDDEIIRYQIESHKVYFDRRMRFQDVSFMWEVDRGTEPMGADNAQLYGKDRQVSFNPHAEKKSLRDKIAKYIDMAHQQNYRMTVLFTVQDWRYGGYDDAGTVLRIKNLLQLIRHTDTDVRFVVADHQDVLENPLGSVFLDPFYPQPRSLQDLVNLVKSK